MLAKDLIDQFNVVARTEYNKSYQAFEPEFKSLVYEYNSGPVASVDFPFYGFLQGMEEFTGSRKHQTFPEGYKFTVTNKEWDMAVDIPVKDIERASEASNISMLNPYKLRVSEMPKIAKDQPYELAFDMLEAGDANTYGTCFDGQNLFDTTHDYGTSAGSQNNIVTGTGVTAATIHADILSVRARFASFYYLQGGTGNAKKRKLNKSKAKLMVVAPTELEGVLFDLQNKDVLATGETNSLKGTFDYTTRPFTDTSDWYAVLIDESIFKPFLLQIEKPAELDMPTVNDEIYRERKIFTYGVYARHNVAYGAWWKAIQVTNT